MNAIYKALIFSIIFISGCHGELVRKIAENDRMKTSIPIKGKNLQLISVKNQELLNEKKNIGALNRQYLAELDTLSQELMQLKERNDSIKAVTDAQLAKQKEIDSKIAVFNERSHKLENNGQLTDKEKIDKVQQLRKEMKETLKEWDQLELK